MKLYCINNLKKGVNTAGSKAPADCYKIAAKSGAEEIIFYQPPKYAQIVTTRFFAFFTGMSNWNRLLKLVEPGSYVILQHPNQGIFVANRYIEYCKRKKGLMFIALIHDLDSLRKNIFSESKMMDQRNIEADEVFLHKCDYIICHNDSMKFYLIQKGFDEKQLISLGIFDYLHDAEITQSRKKEKSIVVAGNLFKNKCEYLYKLIEQEKIGFTLHLFGPNYSGSKDCEEIVYHGQCSPEQLPSKLVGAFGLVWDGTEVDTCSGNTGEYLRYNNPHKCSLFLASNMPVIIWKEAALARFIMDRGVGICVDSLNDIGQAIEAVSDEEYAQMMKNVIAVGEEIRMGSFLSAAISKIRRNEEC